MRKKNSVLHATMAVSIFAILGKIIGLGREALIAAYYGTTAATDAFFFAQEMPKLIYPTIGDSIAMAFVSLYVKRLTEKGEGEGKSYASRMLYAMTIFGALLSGLGVLIAPLFVPLLAPGFSGTQLSLAVSLTRLTMGTFLLTILVYMLGAILNSNKKFIGSSLAGLLYNMAIIIVTVVLGSGQSVYSLMITVVLGKIIQTLFLALLSRGYFKLSLRVNPFHKDVLELFRLALPLLLGNSVWQINNIVDKALASLQQEGAISALSYANSLNALVMTVFVTSLSTVLFPTLSAESASKNSEQFSGILLKSLKGVTILLVPIMCIVLFSAEDIVDIVFARGSFDKFAVANTSVVLICYAPRFLFAGIKEVVTRGFFAVQDTKTPAFNSAIGVICNIIFSLIFVRWLGLAGIAIGTTTSAFVSAILLMIKAKKRFSELKWRDFKLHLVKQLIAGGGMVALLYFISANVNVSVSLISFLIKALGGFAVYGIILFIIDKKEIMTMFSTIVRRK